MSETYERTLCLNCGAFYGERDCPNLGDGRHSVERAARIAQYLLDRGCTIPRSLDVRDAGNAIDAIDRG